MRLPFPRRQTLNGTYGGFGRRPADKAYKPPVTPPVGSTRLARKHRRLRLRRLRVRQLLRRVRKPTTIEIVIAVLLALAGLVLVFEFVFRLMRRGAS